MIKELAGGRIRSAALGLLLMGISLPMASSSFAAEVLLLADEDSTGTRALVEALTAAEHQVTQVTPEYTWDNTNPALTGFECVVHLNGSTFQNPLPVSAQQALENFVSSGQGGFIGSQWNGFELSTNQQVAMPNLVLQLHALSNGPEDQLYTDTALAGEGETRHPVLAGVPTSFTFPADAHDDGPAVQPSTVLMTSRRGGPGVIVREFGNGRVVNFSHAANFGNLDLTLQDPNIKQLYLNAVAWACPSAIVPDPPSDPRNEVTLQIWKAHFKLNHKKPDRDKFKIQGSFEAFANGDGTDHLPGDLTVTLQGFSQMIAAEHLVRKKNHFTYRDRSQDGWITRLTIRDDGRFKVVGKHVNLQELDFNEAVAFSIAMGPDYGEASITLNHRGRLRDKDRDKDRDDDDDDDKHKDDDDDDDKDEDDDDD